MNNQFEISEGGAKAAGSGDSSLNLASVCPPGTEKWVCTEQTHTEELSKVGPYLSTEIDINTYCTGAAHPSDSHQFKTVDSRSGR